MNNNKNIIRISESGLKSVIYKSVRDVLTENKYNDDLSTYSLLRKIDTGLNVDILIDDGGAYEIHNHEIICFMRNGYNNEKDYIPISISKMPQILINKTLNVDIKDIQEVFYFIRINYEALLNMGIDMYDSHEDFYNDIVKIINII